MTQKALITASKELNTLLFDADNKEDGWIDVSKGSIKKMTKGIKEAAAIIQATDEITEETLATLRGIDWNLEDYDKEEQKEVQKILQDMGIWVNEDTTTKEPEPEKEEKPKKKASAKKAPAKEKEEAMEVEILEEDTQILTLRDNAKAELVQIKTIEGGIEYLHKVQSIATWMQAEKKDAELQNMVAEQKIRTQRILGELIQEGQESGEIASQSKHGKGIQASMPQGNAHKTLDEIGISRKQSSAFKQIASIPEKEFESFIEEKKAAVDQAVSELTTKGAVHLSKNLKKEPGTGESTKKSKSEKSEAALLKVAEKINTEFSKKERQFIVDHIKL